jgi:hypothetical protein
VGYWERQIISRGFERAYEALEIRSHSRRTMGSTPFDVGLQVRAS